MSQKRYKIETSYNGMLIGTHTPYDGAACGLYATAELLIITEFRMAVRRVLV